jgi:putative FmdB family regulatory protein
VPTYQYACTECGHQLEAVQSFSDAALTECPSCHGRLRKVFNSVGIVFKGSGFYRNDSRSNGASKDEKTTAESSTAPAEKTADKKTESTSAPAAASSSSSSSSPAASSKPSSTAA